MHWSAEETLALPLSDIEWWLAAIGEAHEYGRGAAD